MPANTYRDRLVEAKQALSAALLTPPSPDRPPWRVLGFMHRSGRAFAELSDAARQALPSVVHAVGIGRKITAGELTDTPAVRVYVTRKAAVTGSEQIPETVGGVATDLIEAPPAAFLAAPCTGNRTAAVRPVIGGISTSHVSGDTGTLGCFCQFQSAQGPQSSVLVLSNAHIYAKYGAANAGDDLVQPGTADGGSGGAIATFHSAAPLVFGGAQNEVDAAIGTLMTGVAYDRNICSIGAVNGTAQGVESDAVMKHGRTTGYTEGVIDDELIDFIMLPDNSSSYVKFRNQMRIVPTGPAGGVIAAGGDSGSLVVKKDGRQAVGLLHSAALDGSYAYANHIDKVLGQLGIVLL